MATVVSAIGAIPAPMGYVDVVSSESRPFGQKRMQEKEREKRTEGEEEEETTPTAQHAPTTHHSTAPYHRSTTPPPQPLWKVRRFTDEAMHVSVYTFTQ